MKIILDVMSGDHAPEELIRGAILAAEEFRVEMVVVGDRELIRQIALKSVLDISKLQIVEAQSVIGMEDHPLCVVRDKKDSSMSIGLKLLAAGQGDAFVSAGNTGALLTGATLLVRRIKGINRAAIATVLPFPIPVLLMDSGANLEVTSDNLEQFAFMGAKYMEKIFNLKKPRVGLLNNGTEYNKGKALHVESYQMLLNQPALNFIGNVEGKDIPFGTCDVLVTDGFTGNILLKYTEGMGKFMMRLLKDVLTTNFVARVSAMTMKDKLGILKKRFDASEHGGAPLLGISKPVIKAHGNSDAVAIKNAVFQAMNFVHTGLNQDITRFAAELEAAHYREAVEGLSASEEPVLSEASEAPDEPEESAAIEQPQAEAASDKAEKTRESDKHGKSAKSKKK